MTIYGSDVSHFDRPDTRAMFAEGIAFQTHKAGGDSNDLTLGTWWNLVKPFRDRALLGAYWVLYPGNPAGRADQFIARLDALCAGWRDAPFLLQIDAELWNGNQATKPSVAECNAFADQLKARMPKLTPVGYLPSWVYGSAVSSFRYPLWASSYVGGSGSWRTLYPGDNSSHWNAYGGKTPAILQYSSSATIGGQTFSDVNAFRGTLAELTALVAPGWTTQGVDTMSAEDARDGFMQVLWDAAHASRNDTTYTSAAAGDQQRMRQARDLLKEIIGGPVDQSILLAAIRSDSVDVGQLAAALATTLGPQLSSEIDVSGVEIDQAKLEAALRAVLGSLDNRAV